MNANIPKWITASIASHFKGVTDGLTIRYFVEGVDEPESDDFQEDSALLRVNGPVVVEGSNNEEWYFVEIQILLTDIMQLTEDNAYDILTHAGVYQKSMLENIPIKEIGDSGDLIGCLAPDKSIKNNVRVVNFGQVDKTARVRQMSVTGRFILCP